MQNFIESISKDMIHGINECIQKYMHRIYISWVLHFAEFDISFQKNQHISLFVNLYVTRHMYVYIHVMDYFDLNKDFTVLFSALNS